MNFTEKNLEAYDQYDIPIIQCTLTAAGQSNYKPFLLHRTLAPVESLHVLLFDTRVGSTHSVEFADDLRIVCGGGGDYNSRLDCY